MGTYKFIQTNTYAVNEIAINGKNTEIARALSSDICQVTRAEVVLNNVN